MNLLRSLRIRTRLTLAFACLLLLLCAVVGATTWLSSGINADMQTLSRAHMPRIKLLGEIQEAGNRVSRSQTNHVLATTPEGKKAQAEVHKQALASMDKALAAYKKTVSSADEEALYKKIVDYWTQVTDHDIEIMAMSLSGDVNLDSTREMVNNHGAKAFEVFIEAVNAGIVAAQAGGEQAAQAAEAAYRGLLVSSLSLAVAAIVLGVVFALLVTHSITAPLEKAVQVAQSVAAGDLSTQVVDDANDEPGQLVHALIDMQGKLGRIVESVRSASEGVSIGSGEIAAGNADLSRRTESQASNLQQTAAAMAVMHGSTKHSRDSAASANDLARSAFGAAERGGEIVDKVVATMNDIADSSKQISEIVGMIDGIAFQTNILALNAAVEAARAGEQGRGFAVVASEVRALAQRSADSAKQIKQLIIQSAEKVESGSHLVNEAGRSMSGIVAQSRQLSTLIGEISEATLQQASGIEQVSQSIAGLDQVTQQNSALVEQAAAASDSLRQQADLLMDTMKFFRVDGAAAPPAAFAEAAEEADAAIA